MKRSGPWIAGSVLALIAYAPALYRGSASGWGDWQQFHHWWEVGRVAVTRFGEWPLWDPNHCGGVSMWGQPQAQHFAPTWWITGLAFGTVAGTKLFILLHHVIGFVGMWIVARRLFRAGPPAAALAAIAWAFSGFFGWRGNGGHSTFLAFHYIPWIYYCWRRAHDDPRYAAGVGTLMGLVLFEGGTYPFPLTFLLLAFDALAILIERPRAWWRVLRTAGLGGVLTLLIGAGRLWPVYLTMSRFPRATDLADEDSQTVANVLESLTYREPHAWHWGHRWVWAEYGAFVGWAVIALAIYGAALAITRRRSAHLVLGAIVFTGFAMGAVDDGWPWPLVHELPVYDNLHVPSRFHVLVTFFLVLLAAVALDRALRWINARVVSPGTQRALVALAWITVFGIGVEIVSNDIRLAARWNGSPVVAAEPEPRFHLVGPSDYLERYATYASLNVGTPACYDPVPWPISDRLWIGDQPQARIEPASAGRLLGFSRTNHTLSLRVRLTAPARVIVNQNFDRDWRASTGEVVEDARRLAIDLPAGEHRVRAHYAPADLPWSILATLLGLALAAVLAFGQRLLSKRRAGKAPATEAS